jgi:hypothetical protein
MPAILLESRACANASTCWPFFSVHFSVFSVYINKHRCRERRVESEEKNLYVLFISSQLTNENVLIIIDSFTFYNAGCSFFAHIQFTSLTTIVKVSRVCFQRTNKKRHSSLWFYALSMSLVSVRIVVIVFRSKPQIIATW